jgi:2-polyprenyl-6-methoxyphenol hydroxylase-like FAD-dependent oxidoreductase
VLIVGAGPTGLFLALLLTRLGVDFQIIDKAETAGTTSRALVLHARTLEFYRQIDLAQEVVKRGLWVEAVNLWRQDHAAGRVVLGDMGRGLSPFPYALIFPQDEHERLLIERLEALGARVERQTELTAIERGADRVLARVRRADGTFAAIEASYVAACDGARSTLRSTVAARFPGGTYEHIFYVADVEAQGPRLDEEVHVLLDQAGFLVLFPLAGKGRARLIGTIREDANRPGNALRWEDIDRRPVEHIGLTIERVNWFSTYHVHHRVADRFRRGRVFLLGDAAHVHSPVGGQGMNTGLGDAMNLAWKLAAIIDGRASEDLLETYEPERIAFARRLVATTDRLFQAATSTGRGAEVVRTQVVPRLIPRLAHTKLGRRLLFRAVSQIGIEYRASSWSTGHVGAVHGGDRLPWVEPAGEGSGDNYLPLRSLDWQLHTYGPASDELKRQCEEHRLPLHIFPFDAAAKRVGYRDDASYLVRPDGYLGAVFTAATAIEKLESYLHTHRIRGR